VSKQRSLEGDQFKNFVQPLIPHQHLSHQHHQHHLQQQQQQQPLLGVNVVKLFLSLTKLPNKVKRLFLASLSSLV
jgi:hypothetical protein